MLIAIPIILILVARLFIASNTAIVCLFAAQVVMLFSVIRGRHLTGVGAFLFMSFLFFGMRPVYVWVEEDHRLFEGLFRLYPHKIILNSGMLWGTLGMFVLQIGGILAKNLHHDRWRNRARKAKVETKRFPVVSLSVVVLILHYQVGTLGVMVVMGSAGTALYSSALGAYIYDFPAVMQAGHIFALLLTLERLFKSRNPTSLLCFVLASLFFVIFTLEMRNISLFRGFYLTGLMAGGIAVLARLRPQVNALWLILPVILLLPVFRMLGASRYERNNEFSTVVAGKGGDKQGTLQQYWDFYDGDGDMNIFDTFVAADLSQPKAYPYILSWLYVPVHLVPRAIWTSKPKKGTLQDMDFTYGAPYSPGIAGFFLLDGGRLWMLLSMTTLGYLLALLDWTVLTMPRTYLRFCLYGIVCVNAMGLSRYFLWQYFYSLLYALIPCLLLAKFVNYSVKKSRLKRRDLGLRRARLRSYGGEGRENALPPAASSSIVSKLSDH